ncbi:FtsK/SpoIIIE domain-containing protein [Bifidobacterium bifidum]|nr:FtsK/SpoIIIE domain-containing protein [Bifidobacterium bifidum]
MAYRRRSRARSRQAKPILAGAWFAIPVLIIPIAWWVGLPVMPFLLIGMLLGGLTARFPQPRSGRKTDQPDPRDMTAYHRWKDMLAGIIPNKDWLEVRRVSWWMGWAVGVLATPGSAGMIVLAVNMLAAFPCMMGFIRWRDRAADRRHVYKGVSVPGFLKHGSVSERILACAPSLILLAFLLFLFMRGLAEDIGHMSLPAVIALPAMLFLVIVWLLARKPQSQYWHDLVDTQQLVDKWASGSDLWKAWEGAYVTQVDHKGDPQNPLTVIRITISSQDGQKRSVDDVFKTGVEKVKAVTAADGYSFVCLLAARQRKAGAFQFDPSSFRLALGRDESSIPSIGRRDVGEGLATLVCDIAYARTALIWNKRAPLTEAKDVSADGEKAAWLLLIHTPPSGGDPIDKIGFDWLGGDWGPDQTLHLPVFADLTFAFHLVAEPDTPLSDRGNRWRPDGMTLRKPFADYISVSRRCQSDQSTWSDLIGNKLPAPIGLYDGEKELDCDGGWTLRILPLRFTPPSTAADYARLDLSTLAPDARYVGVIGEDQSGYLLTADGAAPTRIENLTGGQPHIRQYAQCIVFKALLDVLPAKTGATIDSCTQEGRDVAIWRVKFHLDRGGTVMDVRKQAARVESAVGATHVYWDWQKADMASLWLCRDPHLGVEDLPHWRRRQMQKLLIELALSDAWGDAGVTDSAGRTPKVVKLGALPHNHDVLLARFDIPAGLDVDKPQHNIGKFMTAAGYGYGRILPRGEEHGATRYDMVLAKRSPFPTMVEADWDFARAAEPRMFPLGVDDMGSPVYWNVKDTYHLLVSGKSGTGKSSAAQIIVAEALLKGHGIILVDPSKGCIDFTRWAKPLALAFVGLGQMRETEAVIAWLRDEMAQRVRLLSKYGAASIYELDRSMLSPEELEHVRPIDLFFDEFNSYLQEAGKTTQNPNRDIQLANDNAAVSATNNSIRRTMSALGKIVVQGRTAGISVILGAQRLSMDDMKPYNANALFRSLGRILLGMDSTAGIISQQNLQEANRLQQSLKGEGGRIPQGRGMFETAQGELLAVQTWYSGEQDALAELFRDHPKPHPIDYSPFMPAAAERYGELSDDELANLLNNQNTQTTQSEQVDAEEIDSLLNNKDESPDDIEEVDW